MVCIVHEGEVESTGCGRGVRRRALLDRARIPARAG